MLNVSEEYKQACMDGATPTGKVVFHLESGDVEFLDDDIQYFTVSQQVSSDGQFCLGSVASCMIEMSLLTASIDPYGIDALLADYFDAYIGYEVGDGVEWCHMGRFKANMPETTFIKPTFTTVTAYDMYYWLDDEHRDEDMSALVAVRGSLDGASLAEAFDSFAGTTGAESDDTPTVTVSPSGTKPREFMANACSAIGLNSTLRGAVSGCSGAPLAPPSMSSLTPSSRAPSASPPCSTAFRLKSSTAAPTIRCTALLRCARSLPRGLATRSLEAPPWS